jgi:hypothetical protein
MLKLHGPDRCDLRFLRSWLDDLKGGACFLDRLPIEGKVWCEATASDLVALRRRSDRFAAWVMNDILPKYHDSLGEKLHKERETDVAGSHFDYKDTYFTTACNVFCTILSTALPSSSILVLYYVQDMLARLIIIIVFSLLLSSVMALVSRGRRYEIFAATFAFAAVQVVFVGNVDTVGSVSNRQ